MESNPIKVFFFLHFAYCRMGILLEIDMEDYVRDNLYMILNFTSCLHPSSM